MASRGQSHKVKIKIVCNLSQTTICLSFLQSALICCLILKVIFRVIRGLAGVLENPAGFGEQRFPSTSLGRVLGGCDQLGWGCAGIKMFLLLKAVKLRFGTVLVIEPKAGDLSKQSGGLSYVIMTRCLLVFSVQTAFVHPQARWGIFICKELVFPPFCADQVACQSIFPSMPQLGLNNLLCGQTPTSKTKARSFWFPVPHQCGWWVKFKGQVERKLRDQEFMKKEFGKRGSSACFFKLMHWSQPRGNASIFHKLLFILLPIPLQIKTKTLDGEKLAELASPLEPWISLECHWSQWKLPTQRILTLGCFWIRDWSLQVSPQERKKRVYVLFSTGKNAD